MVTYIASKMVELPKALKRRDTGEPMYMYIIGVIQLVAVATIRERRLFRSALAQVWLLQYSRAAFIRERRTRLIGHIRYTHIFMYMYIK